jgi:hypothetical protein
MRELKLVGGKTHQIDMMTCKNKKLGGSKLNLGQVMTIEVVREVRQVQPDRSTQLDNFENCAFSNVSGRSKYYMSIKPISNFDLFSGVGFMNMDISTCIKGQIINAEEMNETYLKMIHDEKNIFKSVYGYMDRQTDLNEKMRAVLVDWLIDVHHRFKLQSETLFMTIYILDRYLNKRLIAKQYLQLAGICALMIACKFEEIYSPEINDLLIITEGAYTKHDLLLMERDILISLNYDITIPSVLKFYDMLCINFALSEKQYSLGRYLMEMFLLDYRINKYHHSLVACSVIYLVMKINNYTNYQQIKSYCLFNDSDLKRCASDLCNLITNIEMLNLPAVLTKFSTDEYHSVSKMKLF